MKALIRSDREIRINIIGCLSNTFAKIAIPDNIIRDTTILRK
jgi:hypothetical protein